jgi:hypothetical protein
MKVVRYRLGSLALALAVLVSVLAPCVCPPPVMQASACHSEDDGLRLTAGCCCSDTGSDLRATANKTGSVETPQPALHWVAARLPAPAPERDVAPRTFESPPPRLTLRI